MLKFKTSAYVHKRIFNLLSNNNKNISIASKEIEQLFNNYGYKTKIIKIIDYKTINYSLNNLYSSYDFILNDCSSLKDYEQNKLIHEIKNNNFYSWTPFQITIYDSKNTKQWEHSDIIYKLTDTDKLKYDKIINIIEK